MNKILMFAIAAITLFSLNFFLTEKEENRTQKKILSQVVNPEGKSIKVEIKSAQPLALKAKESKIEKIEFSNLSLEDIEVQLTEIQDEIESCQLIQIANSKQLSKEDEKRLRELLKKHDQLQIELIERELQSI